MDYFSRAARKSFLHGFISTKSDKFDLQFFLNGNENIDTFLAEPRKHQRSLVFGNFLWVEKENICMIWTNMLSKYHFFIDPLHYQKKTSAQLLRKSK